MGNCMYSLEHKATIPPDIRGKGKDNLLPDSKIHPFLSYGQKWMRACVSAADDAPTGS